MLHSETVFSFVTVSLSNLGSKNITQINTDVGQAGHQCLSTYSAYKIILTKCNSPKSRTRTRNFSLTI